MGNLRNVYRAWDRPLQFWVLNEELIVSMGHHPMLTTSLSFVHTARRFYRFECFDELSGLAQPGSFVSHST